MWPRWVRPRWVRHGTIAVVVAALAIGVASFPALAVGPTVANGGFETVPGGTTQSYQVTTGSTSTLPGWTTGSTGIGCLVFNTGPTYTMCGNAYASPTQASHVTFAVFPGYSPNGGNFFGSDAADDRGSGGSDYEISMTQTISNLAIGQRYALNFWQAGAQQQGYVGATTDYWQVTVNGTTVLTSAVMSVPQQSIAPWQYQTLFFTATATSEALSFLAIGSPNTAQPPFALLDGISIPEPASIALVGFGIVSVAALRRRRARRPA